MTQLPSASFPVVFFAGDRDVDVGSIVLTSKIAFSAFQSLVANKIGGVSPHQISISLVRRKKARSSPEIRRRVPIDESSDFAAICRERDCFLLAVMRRSRRERRGRGRRGRGVSGGGGGGEEKKVTEMTILKREQGVPIPLGLGFWEPQVQTRNLEMMREKFMAAINGPYYPYDAPAQVAAPVCKECLKAKKEGRAIGFHWCVYDKVTYGFRSVAGPIERPAKAKKNNVEAASST